ncbi:hypothetical protein DOTSEDRAFT_70537 [Lecanosticta acicola]|uniref:Uncharacterized protein n=1 Tax=Lecanosticta acicola TaxID=111012 RepID=A0AAI8YVV8_9PEZI|nr:hypothetical protein DOTSEDRAFT_70537 [Lecanosticta acicola]
MSGVHGQVLGHLVRRGYETAQAHFTSVDREYIQRLKHDANLYDNAGPGMEVKPYEMLPVLITGIITIIVIASVRYTIGEVMASLTMIESQTTTAIVEDEPPAYPGEPDAPIEKEPALSAEPEVDVEVTLVQKKPVTAKITTTMAHLRRVGGWRAQWRGLGFSLLYHFPHAVISHFLGSLLGFGLFGNSLAYIFTSVALSRIHMLWTHSMIALPSNKSWLRRLVPRKQCKALLLPSLVFAAAQQAAFILPVVVALAVGMPEKDHVVQAAHRKDCAVLSLMGLRFLAVPATLLFVTFAVLLPAAVTLTRIEALLLPEGEDTIVPFDRQAVVGSIDLAARGSSWQIFVEAWRSFDGASRWRLIKLYIKMVFVQLFVVFTGLHIVAAELYLVGGQRLGLLIKSTAAQLQLVAIEAQQNGN